MWSKKAPKDVGYHFYAFPTEEHGIVYLLTAIFKHKKELKAWYRGCHINGTKLNQMPEKGVWSEVVRPHRLPDDEFNILMAEGEPEVTEPVQPNFFERLVGCFKNKGDSGGLLPRQLPTLKNKS